MAFADPDLWTYDLVVVCPGFDRLAGHGFPADLSRCQLVNLYSSLDARAEQLVSLSSSLCWKRLDPSFVHLVHCFFGGRWRERRRVGSHGAAAVVSCTGLARLRA